MVSVLIVKVSFAFAAQRVHQKNNVPLFERYVSKWVRGRCKGPRG